MQKMKINLLSFILGIFLAVIITYLVIGAINTYKNTKNSCFQLIFISRIIDDEFDDNESDMKLMIWHGLGVHKELGDNRLFS